MREILSINLSVGRSCFVRCKGCYNHFGKHAFLAQTQHMLCFLRKAKDKGISKVTLCGGDPLSRPDILDLIQKIKSMGFYIIMDTVGTVLLDNTPTIFFGNNLMPKIDAKILAENTDLLGIPVDGASNEEMAYFRTGRSNIFNEQLQIIKILQSVHATLCINTVVNKGNVNNVSGICRQIEQFLPVKKWQLFQFMPIGLLGYRNRAMYEIEDSQFHDFQCAVLEYFSGSSFLEHIEFKAKATRKGNYMLIDANGVAWVPNITPGGIWDPATDSNNDRLIIGSISNIGDHDKVLDVILNPESIWDSIFTTDSQNRISGVA